MAAYRLTSTAGYVVRAADGAFIPSDAQNRDYAEYLAWVAAGNTADPAPEPGPPTQISFPALINRFTTEERVALVGASRVNDNIYLWFGLGAGAPAIDLTDPQVAVGMQNLVDAGVITSDRKTEILTP